MRKVHLLHIANLLGYIALVGAVGSVAAEIHSTLLFIFLGAFLTGLFLDRRTPIKPLFNPLFLLGLVILGIILSILGLSEKNIFTRALGILIIIISAKLISPKKRRDILQIYLLNFFMVTGSAVTRLDLEFGLLILGETFITILGLLLVYGSTEQEEIPVFHVLRLARWSAAITLCLIPATMILFLIIPRPTMALFAWGEGVTSRTGFSDRVTPGAVEEIKVDTSPAFRAKWINGNRPGKIYWRGIVYDRYHLGAWEKTDQREVSVPAKRAEHAEYEVILEPTDSRYLLSVGLPYAVSAKGLRTDIVSGYTIESRSLMGHRVIYRVQSYLVKGLPADSPPGFFLDIPDELREDLTSFTTDLIKGSDLKTAEATEIFLKTKFDYDLLPGETSGDPIHYFLTISKKGHCEYFASAMVLLLRSMGIPARMVGGYLGGEWNDLGQYYLVRQSDAHTWVEAWIEGEGWVTFDPTPPASQPARPRGQIYRFIDMLRLKWYYWVVDYNISRQLELVRKSSAFLKSIRYGDKKVDVIGKIPSLKTFMAFALILILGVLFLYIKGYFKNRPRTYGERLVFLLKGHGYEKKPGETLLELVTRVASDKPGVEKSGILFVKRYYLFEYGRKGDEMSLSRLLGNMEKALKKAA